MIKRAKKGQKKERRQSYDGEIETMPLIYSSYAIITELEDTKKIVEKLRLQYQEEYDKLHWMKNIRSVNIA
jgi:hypothetical protein